MAMDRSKAILLGAVGVAALAIGGAYAMGMLPALAQDEAVLKTEQQQRSYALGMSQAYGFRKSSLDVDAELFSRALKDTLAGGKTLLTEDQARAIVATLQGELKEKNLARQKEEVRALAEKNVSAGEMFLAANKANEGVVTLDSGLQYKILKAGNGKKPTINDIVVVNYRGTLIDGTEFDNSQKRNAPANLPVNKLIKGWSEALQLMPVGSKWQLFIPANLAYGERAMGRVIGPNATVIFDVELVGVKEGTAQNDTRETLASSEKPRRSATPRSTATR
jgi:FKBP-type peptidyl-prolyl cis-trans isomerase FklB